MGRPKRVYPSKLPLYDKLHTCKVKMLSGVEMTALHIIKETERFFTSLECWAHCCSKFRRLKHKTELKFDIPVIKDENAVEFLNTHAWHDFVSERLKEGSTDIAEAIEFMDRVFPGKKKVYFYELNSLLGAYCWGVFGYYDKDGKLEEPTEHQTEQAKYYNSKYIRDNSKTIENPANVKALLEKYHAVDSADDKAKTAAYRKYADARDQFLWENHNKTATYKIIGEHSIVCPYAFTKCCVEGSTYENVGEIYMVVTDDAVYFEICRHF